PPAQPCNPGHQAKKTDVVGVPSLACPLSGSALGNVLGVLGSRPPGLLGLARYAVAPAAVAFGSSPLSANDVTTMMGTAAVRGSLRSCRVASSPDILGSWMSIRMRSGGVASAEATPSSPSSASRRRYVVL